MTPLKAVLGVLTGLIAGMLSGAFGVGGGIVMTPGIAVLLGAGPIQAIATPLPVILPSALVGANNYRRAKQISTRATAWGIGPGIAGAIAGASLTGVVDAHSLLLVTAVLLGWQAVRLILGGDPEARSRGATPGWQYALAGLAGGFVSGLLGVGGGIIMVPVFTAMFGMPLKRALGTSLAVIAVLVVPGTVVHSWLGHIDWTIAAVLVIGVVPGAWVGSRLALAAHDRTLRRAVGAFLMVVAVSYGAYEVARVAGWRT